MANPVLSEKIFSKESTGQGVMTVGGTATKALILLALVFAAGAYTWKIFNEAINPASVSTWMFVGLIGGFITALIISFSPKSAPYLAPIYAVLEGLFLGAISAAYNSAFAEIAPNIVINAILLTFLAAALMFTVFRSGLIKVNSRFVKIIMIAISTVLVYYIILMILRLFGVSVPMLTGSSPLSIGISVVIVFIAAFSLLLDYNFIETASANGAPKYMEWYGAFGLMVTLVWLYLEILKLLGKVSRR